MRVNCYLPDEMGERAKEADLEFSKLLQYAVRNELWDYEQEGFTDVAVDVLKDVEVAPGEWDERRVEVRFAGKAIWESDFLKVWDVRKKDGDREVAFYWPYDLELKLWFRSDIFAEDVEEMVLPNVGSRAAAWLRQRLGMKPGEEL